MELSGLTTMLHEQAGHLSHGAKQALELAMVLAQEPTVLLLDEPTAGLTRDERAAIGSVLTELAQSHRLCILLIEHDLDFVRKISTRLVVLHMGKILLDGPLAVVADVRTHSVDLCRRNAMSAPVPPASPSEVWRVATEALPCSRELTFTSNPGRSSGSSARTAWARRLCSRPSWGCCPFAAAKSKCWVKT